ncbi:MAG: hypothetical protein J6X93_04295 [Bacilli bacterium]|nr:hypothetical protein [Bacilli bacterium]
MNSLVLCEGKTDAILLSYVLINQYGYKPFKDENGDKKNLTPIFNSNLNEYAYWYKNNNSFVLICSVDGCDNISEFFSKYIIPIQKNDYKNENIFEKIVIIRDKDDKTNEEIEEVILSKTNISFLSNKWEKVCIETKFDNINSFFLTYLLIIPIEHSGALEDVVLTAFSEDDNKKIIVEKSCKFIDDIKQDASTYLVSRRLISKAKLGVTLAIMSPEKVFHFIDEMLKNIDWTKYNTIMTTFNVLSELA